MTLRSIQNTEKTYKDGAILLRGLNEATSCPDIFQLRPQTVFRPTNTSFHVIHESIQRTARLLCENIEEVTEEEINGMTPGSVVSLMTVLCGSKQKIPVVNVALKWISKNSPEEPILNLILSSLVIKNVEFSKIAKIRLAIHTFFTNSELFERFDIFMNSYGSIELKRKPSLINVGISLETDKLSFDKLYQQLATKYENPFYNGKLKIKLKYEEFPKIQRGFLNIVVEKKNLRPLFFMKFERLEEFEKLIKQPGYLRNDKFEEPIDISDPIKFPFSNLAKNQKCDQGVQKFDGDLVNNNYNYPKYGQHSSERESSLFSYSYREETSLVSFSTSSTSSGYFSQSTGNFDEILPKKPKGFTGIWIEPIGFPHQQKARELEKLKHLENLEKSEKLKKLEIPPKKDDIIPVTVRTVPKIHKKEKNNEIVVKPTEPSENPELGKPFHVDKVVHHKRTFVKPQFGRQCNSNDTVVNPKKTCGKPQFGRKCHADDAYVNTKETSERPQFAQQCHVNHAVVNTNKTTAKPQFRRQFPLKNNVVKPTKTSETTEFKKQWTSNDASVNTRKTVVKPHFGQQCHADVTVVNHKKTPFGRPPLKNTVVNNKKTALNREFGRLFSQKNTVVKPQKTVEKPKTDVWQWNPKDTILRPRKVSGKPQFGSWQCDQFGSYVRVKNEEKEEKRDDDGW